MFKNKINTFFSNKKFLILLFSFIFLLLLYFSMYFFNMKLNKKEEITVPSEIKPSEANTLTLHFSADGRLPYDWYADWIVIDSFIRGVYGTLTYLTSNGLFMIDHEDSLLNSLETENGDPSKLILGIKKGLYFEKNGVKVEFTSKDLKFSYSIPFFLKEEDIFVKSDLMKIKGMDKIIPGEVYSDEKVTGITILDKYTIKIEFEYGDPDIIRDLSTSKYPIVSKYFYQNKISGELTPGLGKYEVIRTDKSTGEALLKRKIHVDGYPDYVKFISTVDKRGDILWRDMWGKLNSHYRQEIIKIPYGTLGVFFNYNSKLGNNKSFRKSINIAINRKKLCEGFPYLIPNYQVLPDGYWGRIEAEEQQDIFLAKQLLSKIKDIPNPLFITMGIGLSGEELKKPYWNELKEQLKVIGLNPIYVEREGNKPFDTELVVSSIVVPFKDPKSVFQFFLDGSTFSKTYPKNDEIIRSLFYKLNATYKDEKRLYYAKKLSNYIYENNIFVPLFDVLSEYNINEERIETIGNQPAGMLFDIWKVKLKNEKN
jgi:ABC-type transport system substrate-binding protein